MMKRTLLLAWLAAASPAWADGGLIAPSDNCSIWQIVNNEALNNSFIVQYVRARESYDTNLLVQNYNIVRIMSEPARVYSEFVEQVDPSNPESNVARLGSTGTRALRFKSISYLDPQTAQIRMIIEEKGDSIPTTLYHKIVLVKFEYIKLTLSTEERYINPLGFRVTDYRIDEDILQK